MSSDQGLFGGQDRPDAASAWALYEESVPSAILNVSPTTPSI